MNTRRGFVATVMGMFAAVFCKPTVASSRTHAGWENGLTEFAAQSRADTGGTILSWWTVRAAYYDEELCAARGCHPHSTVVVSLYETETSQAEYEFTIQGNKEIADLGKPYVIRHDALVAERRKRGIWDDPREPMTEMPDWLLCEVVKMHNKLGATLFENWSEIFLLEARDDRSLDSDIARYMEHIENRPNRAGMTAPPSFSEWRQGSI